MARAPLFKLPTSSRKPAPTPPGGQKSSDPKDPLGAIPLFALVSPQVRDRVRKKLQLRSYAEGKVLFQVNEPADALYVVHSGRFRVHVRGRDKQERVLQFLGPGEVVGEAAFMAGTTHVTTADAADPSKAWRISREDFEALLGAEPQVLRYLAGIIAQRQAQVNARLAKETAPDEARTERGYVTAFFSPRGGAGTTTLAVATGVALAEDHPDDVALLDLDVLFGSTLNYLWLSPQASLSEASLHSLAQIERRNLDYYLAAHESSLRIMPGAKSAIDGERVGADFVRAGVSALRRYFGHVILDLPHNFSDAAITGLELADRVFVLATPELTTLRDVIETRRIFSELLGMPDEKVRFILNHPNPYGGVPVADFAAATGVPWEELTFGGDGPALAALRGESLLKTRSGNPVSKLAMRLGQSITRDARDKEALTR